jgi:hypothetical protein
MGEYVAGRPSWETAAKPHVIIGQFVDRRQEPIVGVVHSSKVGVRDEHPLNLSRRSLCPLRDD